MQPDTTPTPGAQPIPVIRVDEAEVSEAYEAFCSLRRLAQAEPGLTQNRYFTALQDTAYARFHMLFEVL